MTRHATRTAATAPRHAPRRALQSACTGLLLLLIAAAPPGCRRPSNTFAPPPPPEVTVAHPVRRTVTRYLEYTGATEAYESVELRARVPGFLTQVNFRPGARVKQGDVLFVIDPRVYQAAVKRAEAEMESRKASARLAKITLERTTEAIDAGAASPQELDRAAAEHESAVAQVALAQAVLESARLDLEFCDVRAPIDGRITRNYVDVGNLVGASGEPTVLATIVSDSPLYVNVDVSEADLMMVRRARMIEAPAVEPGQLASGEWRPVDLAIGDADVFDIRGRVDYVDPAIDPETGTTRVRCRFENENHLLPPGLFVRLRAFLDESEATLVPESALRSDQIGRYALVVNDESRVELRRVNIGVLDGRMRVVTEGLTPADRVIVNGIQRARPGAEVSATLEAPKPSDAPTGNEGV